MLLSLLFSEPLTFIIIAIALIISISIHEFAHAWAADHLGDPTPRTQDRVTLNPKAHLDPLGLIMIFLAGFGWGKPVMFDPYNLKEPIRDSAIISLAGPVSNITLAILISLLINFTPFGSLMFGTLGQAASFVLYINVMLAVFNLIPIHPLDGGKILVALLPKDVAYDYEIFMRNYGTWLLIAMIIPWSGVSPAVTLIRPVIDFILNILL